MKKISKNLNFDPIIQSYDEFFKTEAAKAFPALENLDEIGNKPPRKRNIVYVVDMLY